MRDVSIDRSNSSRTRIVLGLLVTLFGAGLLALGLFGNGSNGLAQVGLGIGVVFLGVAVLGPTIAAPLSRLIGAPIRKVKGITGALAEENAVRNPKRTSATAAALMIGVALVGLITIFAASARTSINGAIDRSMKADYVVNSSGFGTGSIPVVAEDQLRTVPNVKSVSGVRTTQAKIKGSVDFLWAADPAKINSLFDLQPKQGNLSKLSPTGIAVLDTVASDNNLKMGDKVKVVFPSTGEQEFTVESIFSQAGFANWVVGLDAFEKNVPDQFDNQIYIKTSNGVTPANTAALKKVVADYPGPKLETREQFKQTQVNQVNQLLNLIYVLLFFAIVIALFGIANTLGLSIIERTHELGLLRAVGMTAAAAAFERALGVGDHRPVGHVPRVGDRRGVRVGVGARSGRPGNRPVLARPRATARDRGARRRVRRDRRHLAGPPRRAPRHPRVDPHRVIPGNVAWGTGRESLPFLGAALAARWGAGA